VALHVGMLGLLVRVARLEHLGWLAYAGVGAVAVLLAYEHALVKPSDLSQLNAAFFTLNGYISVLFFVTSETLAASEKLDAGVREGLPSLPRQCVHWVRVGACIPFRIRESKMARTCLR
jgi:hypothetical protein